MTAELVTLEYLWWWNNTRPHQGLGHHTPTTRKVIYTTNAIESLNYQLRKIIKNRGHFPQRGRSGEAALTGDHEHRGQTSPITRQTSRPTPYRTRQTRRGQTVTGWKAALAELAMVYPDRINPYL